MQVYETLVQWHIVIVDVSRCVHGNTN